MSAREKGTHGAAPPSVGRVATASIAAFGVLVVVVVAALVWASTQLQRGVADVMRDTRSQAITSEIELSLLMHARLSNLYYLTGESELLVARSGLGSEMRELVVEAGRYVGSGTEQQLLDEVRRRLDAYLQEQERLEAREDRAASDNIRRMRGVVSAAVEQLESLRDLNAAQVREAHARAARVNQLANLAGIAAGAAVIAGLLVGLYSVRRHVVRPVLALHESMSRVRSGDPDARAPSGGLREFAELATGFNEMADALARQREDQLTFLAGVAHDLKNPLAGIKMGIHSLERDQSETRRNRTRTRIDRQVDRLARMVEDLLDATRIEAGRLEIRTAEFDVRDVIEDVVRLYEPTSPDHRITAETPPEPVRIEGDSLRIEQVVSNLVSNAIKFSPEGGPIDIAVAAGDDEVVVSVADRGVGIPRDQIGEIFSPFRRGGASAASGAGLGLSVVRRIVTAHRGTIGVESEPGQGAVFRVRLPRRAAPPEKRADVGPRDDGDGASG